MMAVVKGRGSRILVAEPLSRAAMRRLRTAGDVVTLKEHDEAALLAAVGEADALIVRTYARVSAAVIAAGQRLKVIGRAGIGVENIDTAAAAHAGVVVVHTPAASTEAVAELALGMILALSRRIEWAQQELRAGRFLDARSQLACMQLGEQILGIVGFGRIGQRLAQVIQRTFGSQILFNDIRRIDPLPVPAQAVSKEELYARSDIVSLHVPLTERTRRLIDAAALAQMMPHALLINTSRGAVVDAWALADALHGGRLGGAAIDVFEPEPPAPDHVLLAAPNCLLTPHIASRTSAALAAMNEVVEDVLAVLDGRPPRFPYEGQTELA